VGDLPYRKLIVWQKAHSLAMAVLDIAEQETLARQWELRDQITAAALSVPANIAEGNGRSTPLDYASFLDRARGSLFETDYWLLVLAQRGHLSPASHEELTNLAHEVGAMLTTMSRKLRTQSRLSSR
jgi:four helix bundle protein